MAAAPRAAIKFQFKNPALCKSLRSVDQSFGNRAGDRALRRRIQFRWSLAGTVEHEGLQQLNARALCE
jgi:hypothetical protein